jgi:hypothetical protein
MRERIHRVKVMFVDPQKALELVGATDRATHDSEHEIEAEERRSHQKMNRIIPSREYWCPSGMIHLAGD